MTVSWLDSGRGGFYSLGVAGEPLAAELQQLSIQAATARQTGRDSRPNTSVGSVDSKIAVGGSGLAELFSLRHLDILSALAIIHHTISLFQ